MLFQIKCSVTAKVLFEKDCDSLKLCVEAAVSAGAYLADANLAGANLARAYLADANLADAYLAGAYLADATLAGANLAGANLAGAYLADANLAGANLARAYLAGANLAGTNLAGANLAGAYLAGANLARATLAGAKGIRPELSTDLLMLLDQPGKIRAYKLVNNKGEGPMNGGLKYEIGKGVAVADANTNADEQCAAGVNVATLPWCLREWRPGYRILIVEFEAGDIAAIPNGTDGKFRLHRCDVIAEKVLDYTALGLVKKEAA